MNRFFHPLLACGCIAVCLLFCYLLSEHTTVQQNIEEEFSPCLSASVRRTGCSKLEICVQNWDSEKVFLLCSPLGLPYVTIGDFANLVVNEKGAEKLDGACIIELVANPSGPKTKRGGAWATYSNSIMLPNPLPETFMWRLEVMALRASEIGAAGDQAELWRKFCSSRIQFEGCQSRGDLQ